MVAAAQTTSNYQFDESQLGQVKELVSNLKTRLEVAEKLVNAESTFQDEIPVDKPAAANIVQQVSEYFADPRRMPRLWKKSSPVPSPFGRGLG